MAGLRAFGHNPGPACPKADSLTRVLRSFPRPGAVPTKALEDGGRSFKDPPNHWSVPCSPTSTVGCDAPAVNRKLWFCRRVTAGSGPSWADSCSVLHGDPLPPDAPAGEVWWVPSLPFPRVECLVCQGQFFTLTRLFVPLYPSCN